jgi:hypothetical protein
MKGARKVNARTRLTDSHRARRPLTIAVFAVLVGAIVVPAALAGKPDRHLVPIGKSVDVAPGQACPSAVAPAGVRIELIGGNEAVTFFDDGRLLVTGLHVNQVTNIAYPDRSVILDVHGSYSSIPQPDGGFMDDGRGTTGFTFAPGDAGPGDRSTARFYLFTGHVRFVEDSSGAPVSWSLAGQMEDVCALVA